MKKIKIVGEAVVRFTQYLDVPDDELDELLGDVENLKCNVDEDSAQKDIIEWNFIGGAVT